MKALAGRHHRVNVFLGFHVDVAHDRARVREHRFEPGAHDPGRVEVIVIVRSVLRCRTAACLSSGGDGCLFEGLEFCYSSGFFAYKVTPAAPLTITLSGNLTSLELFFSHQGAASGEMRFFDAVVGGNEVGTPLATNGDCLVAMPPMQLLSFPTPVRRIEVTASGGRFDAVWIDDFHVNPVPPCPADLDGTGDVGILDLLALLAAWGPNPGHPADFDDDGTVGILDLLALLANWGPCA